ncbi:MAG: ATP-grasp domain-containing protein [Xanthobacteraceae bacterium]
MPRPTAVLIAAASGRALAASARRSGYTPLVADFFGDEDTLAAAGAHVRLPDGLTRGMCSDRIVAALEDLARVRKPAGIVCGTGFEDRPELLVAIARRWRLLGNGADVVVRTKDPRMLAELCGDCGIPHPALSLEPPADPAGWLRKRKGGAGGRHIRAAAHSDTAGEAFYFQRRVEGRPVSALVVADGRRALVLGFSAQWCSPTADHPFRYGGAVRPAALTRTAADAMIAAVQRLVPKLSLVGLNSADFLVDRGSIQLLEINPRPGATLDIFEPHDDSIFAMHIAACEGILPARAPSFEQAKASAIVYAERDVAVFPALDWPAWTADRSGVGTAVAKGDPLCTVLASAPSAPSARALAQRRAAMIVATTNASLAA